MFNYETLFDDPNKDDWLEETEPSQVLEPGMKYLYDLTPGEVFAIGEERFIVLEIDEMTGLAKVIRQDLLPEYDTFGECADWKQSHIREKLNQLYYAKLSAAIGAENIIDIRRNLTSLDGLDDYGDCVDKVSLLTASEYAKYHKILGVGNRYSNWWWTITPASTPSNSYNRSVCFVNSNGLLNWYVCDNRCGVRPFCILNYSILVSCKAETERVFD